MRRQKVLQLAGKEFFKTNYDDEIKTLKKFLHYHHREREREREQKRKRTKHNYTAN